MLEGWFIFLVSLAYLGLLFLIASFGDRRAEEGRSLISHPAIYVLSLAVYCTSWTFYGSVGLAASTGYDFLPVYLGPILMFTLGWPVINRILRVAKAQNITSIADFIAARYGKSQGLAAAVTVIAVVGIVPYIALQLKAVASNFNILLNYPEIIMPNPASQSPWWADTALIVALMMAAFTILFGTRKIDATEHHEGLVLAIAFESVVKLLAFLAVGLFVTFSMFSGLGPMVAAALDNPAVAEVFTTGPDPIIWLTTALVAMVAIVCLPRQFQVAIVENTDAGHLKKAAWLFPLYLVVINLFVIPIAMGGLLTFPAGTVDGDSFVLALPMAAKAEYLTLLAFIGGLSAATGMVIVATVALSTMVCNDLVVPIILRRRRLIGSGAAGAASHLLLIRRLSIVVILVLAFVYYRMIGEAYALASIGLMSFAAVAQFAPAMIAGLYWRGAHLNGASWGIGLGFAVWTYTLMLPTLAEAGILPITFITDGVFGIDWLRPRALFGIDGLTPLSNGVVWSLAANIGGLIAGSLLGTIRTIDRVQASAFLRPGNPGGGSARLNPGQITIGELQSLAAPFVGARRIEQILYSYALLQDSRLDPDAIAELGMIQQVERLLAGVLGASSARLVMALSLERQNLNVTSALTLLDDASAAIQYSRSLLQSALENVSHGIAVFDENLKLICHNQYFLDVQGLTAEQCRSGTSFQDILRFVIAQGDYGDQDARAVIKERVAGYLNKDGYRYIRRRADGTVLEVQTSPVKNTGVVATFTDITEKVAAEAALREANEGLERRVDERTRDLSLANDALRDAKAAAEEANVSKTRFLAAASHDLMQPLNAARLFIAALAHRQTDAQEGGLITQAEASLTAVDDLLSTLLEIAKLDAKSVPAQISDFELGEVFTPLRDEFSVLAAKAGLDFRVVASSVIVRSDPKLLRRVLQNFLTNAVRYTPEGSILMGARRRGKSVTIEVWDTGPGIAADKTTEIFKEFHRLEDTPAADHGVGLGLAIVDRIATKLSHPLTVRSEPGRGSVFSITLPAGEAPVATLAKNVRRFPAGDNLAGRRVLCLDNDRAILNGLEALLGRWSCEILPAESMADALAVVEGATAPPDLIIADYHLTDGTTGLDVLAALERQTGIGIPAILVTADRSDIVRAAAQAAGCMILNKPVRPAALRATMMRCLSSSPGAKPMKVPG